MNRFKLLPRLSKKLSQKTFENKIPLKLKLGDL
jgi:hypothetical protein